MANQSPKRSLPPLHSDLDLSVHYPASHNASSDSPTAFWRCCFRQPCALGLLIWTLIFSSFGSPSGSTARGDEPVVDFETQVWPLLKANCVACHQAGGAESGVNLESPQAMRSSDFGDVIVAGKPEESRLYQVASGLDEPAMPPEENDVGARALIDTELQLIERWILQGGHGEAASMAGELAELESLPPEMRASFAVALSDDARLAAVAIGNRLRVLALPSGEVVARPRRSDDTGTPVPPHVDFVYSLAMSADGRTLVSGGFRNFKVWRFRPLRSAARTVVPLPIIGPAIAWRDATLLSVGEQGQLLRIETDGSAQVLAQLDTPRRPVQIAGDAATGLAVVTSSAQALLVEESQPIALEYPASPITSMAVLSRDRIVAGTEAGQLVYWNRSEDAWSREPPIPCSESPIHSLHRVSATPASAESTEADTLLAVDAPGQIHRVDPEGDVQSIFQLPEPPIQVAFSDSVRAMAVLESGSLLPFRFVDAESDGKISVEAGEVVSETPWARRRADGARWQHRIAEGRFEAATRDAEAAAEALEKEKASRQEADERADEAKTKLQQAEQEAEKASQQHAEAAKALETVTAELEQARSEEGETDALEKQLAAAGKKADEAKQAVDKQQAAVKAAQATLESAAAAAMRSAELQQRAQRHVTEAETSRDQLEQQSQQAAAAGDAAEQQAANSHFRDAKVLWVDSMAITWTAAAGDVPARWDAWHSSGRWLGPLDLASDHRPIAASDAVLWTAGPDATVTRQEMVAEPWQLDFEIGDPHKGGPLVDRVLALDISSDGRYLAVGGGVPSQAGQLQVWDLASGSLIAEPESPHDDTVLAVQFSPDLELLATGGADRMIHLWQVDEGNIERTATLEGHTHHVTALAWQADGRQLASGSADMSIKLWDPATRSQNRSIDGFAKEVTAIGLVGTGEAVAAVGGDGRVRIRRTDNGRSIAEFAAAPDYVYALAVDRDGRHLLTGDTEGKIRLFDPKGKDLGQYEPE